MGNNATIQELAKGLRRKKFSSVELVQASLVAAKRDTLNAFITINDRALEQAKAADARIARGKTSELTGIPIAVKDVLVTEGLRTTAGSRILENYVPPYTATAVKRLVDAGMVIVGKTNCDEFAMGSSNENSAYGSVKNPYDPTRVPGGSSGGSAVAVAAGYTAVALGTDTGGSVRQPASFCGTIGFKPTYGRISRYGLIAMASSLDQVGIFSRSAYDCALLLSEMAGHDARDATAHDQAVPDYVSLISKPLPALTIGLPKEYWPEGERVIFDLQERARKQYKAFPRIKFVTVTIPRLPYALAAYYIIMSSEVSANLARFDGLRYGVHGTGETLEKAYLNNRTKGFGAEVRRRIMLGTYALSAGYYDAYYAHAAKVRRLLYEDFQRVFGQVDAVLCPTSPTPAFKLGEKQSDPLLMYLSDIYTVAANLVGVPAVSYPAGTIDHLPIGLQLMGPAWSEAKLLNLVHHVMAERVAP